MGIARKATLIYACRLCNRHDIEGSTIASGDVAIGALIVAAGQVEHLASIGIEPVIRHRCSVVGGVAILTGVADLVGVRFHEG